MSFDYMELAQSSQIRTHYIHLWSGQCRDVVWMENLVQNLFMAGVQGREVLYCIPYPFEHGIIVYGRGIIYFPLVV